MHSLDPAYHRLDHAWPSTKLPTGLAILYMTLNYGHAQIRFSGPTLAEPGGFGLVYNLGRMVTLKGLGIRYFTRGVGS
ncbi:hypothetical protein BGZ63DRAFT_386370 [Mariannaea sp. PMI_226]|nr:hypothetical protein BGZ63DRAFT_386370 [Mariannaea sp. PMI_226]